LTMAQHADLILVVDRGRIIESGCHQELAQAGGLYNRLLLHQASDAALLSPATVIR
jgi:ABC-type multidrug transport system fused ATPase/permease subunit